MHQIVLLLVRIDSAKEQCFNSNFVIVLYRGGLHVFGWGSCQSGHRGANVDKVPVQQLQKSL